MHNGHLWHRPPLPSLCSGMPASAARRCRHPAMMKERRTGSLTMRITSHKGFVCKLGPPLFLHLQKKRGVLRRRSLIVILQWTRAIFARDLSVRDLTAVASVGLPSIGKVRALDGNHQGVGEELETGRNCGYQPRNTLSRSPSSTLALFQQRYVNSHRNEREITF